MSVHVRGRDYSHKPCFMDITYHVIVVTESSNERWIEIRKRRGAHNDHIAGYEKPRSPVADGLRKCLKRGKLGRISAPARHVVHLEPRDSKLAFSIRQSFRVRGEVWQDEN